MAAAFGRRTLNALGAAACIALLAYAYYAQHVVGLEPCPLCIFQRIAVAALGAVFMIAAIHDPKRTGARVYAGLVALAAGAGAFIAGRHVYIQGLPPDQVPSCGASLDYMVEIMPLTEVVGRVLRGSGQCALVDWSFLGLSMPAWVLISLAALGLAGVWNNLRSMESAQARRRAVSF